MAGRYPSRTGDADHDAALADHIAEMKRTRHAMPASRAGPLDGEHDPDQPCFLGVRGLSPEMLAEHLGLTVAELAAVPEDALRRRGRQLVESRRG